MFSFGSQVLLQGNWGTYTGLGISKHNSGVFSGTAFGPEWAPTRERGDSDSQFLITQSGSVFIQLQNLGIPPDFTREEPLGKGSDFFSGPLPT